LTSLGVWQAEVVEVTTGLFDACPESLGDLFLGILAGSYDL